MDNVPGNEPSILHGVSLEEASARLGKSPKTVRRWLNEGKLRGRKIPRAQGYTWRVYLDAEPGTAPGTDVDNDPETTGARDEITMELVRTLRGQLEAQNKQIEELTGEVRELREQAQRVVALIEGRHLALTAIEAPAVDREPHPDNQVDSTGHLSGWRGFFRWLFS